MLATILTELEDSVSAKAYWQQVGWESDLIVTAVFLGLVAQMQSAGSQIYIEREPFSQGEDKKKWQKSEDLHQEVIDKLVSIFDWNGTLFNACTTEMHGKRSLIVAKSKNNIAISEQLLTRDERALMAKSFEDGTRGIWYEGRGAYHGAVLSLKPGYTKIVAQSDTRRVAVGTRGRWKPAKALRPDAPKPNDLNVWGLIGGDKGESTPDGLGTFPTKGTASRGLQPEIVVDDQLVGYEHGMCRCMNLSGDDMYASKTAVIELALGDLTKKAASCFPCTTYMISNSVPPTGIHLGSGESWVPPALSNSSATNISTTAAPTTETAAARSQVSLWKSNIESWGTTGIGLLLDVSDEITSDYHASLELLANANAKAIEEDAEFFSLKFLDALTFHRKELDRIANVFGVSVS